MKKKWFILIALFALAFYLYRTYGYLLQSARNNPKTDRNIALEPVKLAPAASDPELAAIKLPEGFTITFFARNVPGARSMTRGDNGVVYVGTRGEGVIYALVDDDKDGRADTRYVVASGLNTPNGVAYVDGNLYVAEISRILKFADIDTTYSQKPDYTVIYDLLPSDTHHGWRYMRAGPDGKLYLGIGAPCNVCERTDPYAAIARINTDGSDFEIIARGIRNTVGFDWDPHSGDLWFSDNGRDLLGDDVPPDELNHATGKDLHFGFPYCHGKTVLDPAFGKGRSCADYTPPLVELGPHVAALGLRFYRGVQFPKVYRNKIFIAEHGSWNRTVPIGYRVTTVDVGGDAAGNYQVFAEGWLGEDGDAWGRPVDILELPSGSLLVSDDLGGVIYKISYIGEE